MTLEEVLQRSLARPFPLTRPSAHCGPAEASLVREIDPKRLFAGFRAPEAAWSGILLRLGCWNESHEVSQAIETSDGSYWHGIAHRMEPDSWNAKYWFRRVGRHAIYPELRARAAQIIDSSSTGRDWRLPAEWDAALWVDWCDEARSKPGSEKESLALRIQEIEWQLLFDWCRSSL